jgi:L-ascorbate metabolism protein UlaG (beta-lactamase superfamily)
MPTLTWLGQAGFLVEAGSLRVLFDPFLSDGPERLVAPPLVVEAVPDVSVVFVSHGHPDHFDPESLQALVELQPGLRVVVPEGIEAPASLPCRPGDELEVGGLVANVVPAMHGVEPSDAYRFGPFHGYVVELDGVRLYHAGDTLAWDGLAPLLRDLAVDVALLPINGRDPEREAAGTVGNMDHREAVALAAEAGCRVLVPMHYGMYASNTVDPAIAVEHAGVARPDLEVRLPILGSPIVVEVEAT